MRKALLCGACVTMLCCGVAVAEDAADLPKIVPAPRHMRWTEGAPAWLPVESLECYVVPPDCEGVAGGIEQVDARLGALGLAPLPVRKEAGGGAVRLAVQPSPELEKRFGELPEPKAEGYRLLVSDGGVFILGKDLPGVYYGLVTLSRLIEKEGRIARVAISDWPDQRVRGTYMAGSGDWKNRIPYFASLKMNLILFEDGDFYGLNDPDVRDHWEQVFALCRRHFIDPVPELQSLGWGHFVLSREPRVAEGVYVEKRPFEVADGLVQSPDPPTPPPLDIVNAGFEEGEGNQITGWSQDAPGTEASVDRENAHAGTGCVRLTRAETGMLRVWQDVDCLPGKRYEVSCYLKTKDIAEGAAYIEVYGLVEADRLGALIGSGAPKIRGTTDWQRTATRFDTTVYKRVRIYVRIQEGIGTAWFDEVAVEGVQSPNPLANVLVTDASPVVVQDETGSATYEEGKDYRLTVPKIEYPYESGDPLEIEALPGGRIKDGATVLLSYNYAPAGSITCCPSDPVYQEFMRKAVHNTIRYLKPKYLHIGHDEPRVMNRDKRCTDRGMTSGEIFVEDVKKMREYARKADPDVRIMMWDDAVNPYQNAPSLGIKNAAELIPKDVVICIWWYSERNWEYQIEKSTEYFLEHGFDITGSPWFNPKNAYRWAETLYRHGKDNPHALGSLYTSWGHESEDPWASLCVTAEYSWTIHKPPLEGSENP